MTASLCFNHWLHRVLTPSFIPQPLVDTILSKTRFWYGGLLAGLSILIEDKRRHGDLAMYVLPKGLESAWTSSGGSKMFSKVFRTRGYGDVLVSAGTEWKTMFLVLIVYCYLRSLHLSAWAWSWCVF